MSDLSATRKTSRPMWRAINSACGSQLPDAGHNLSSSLTEEWFLLLVFGHLIELGFQECRLVCKHWYKVCQQLPVKLKGIAHYHLERAVRVFPNAVSVSCHTDEEGLAIAEMFQFLTSLHNLKTLEFTMLEALNLSEAHLLYFQSLPKLRELDLNLLCFDPVDDIRDSIRYLTNLTKLKVAIVFQRVCPARPFVELERIQDLDVQYFFLTDDRSTCFFPSLTNLKRLSLTLPATGCSIGYETLQAVSRYASSLRHLSLSVCSSPEVDSSFLNFAPLSLLTSLRTLEIDDSISQDVHFWQAIENLQSVTKLKTCSGVYVSASMRKYLPMLAGLEVLDAEGLLIHDKDRIATPLAPEMTNLTDLTVSVYGSSVGELRCLTQLERLRLHVVPDDDCCLDDVLSFMPRLHTLQIAIRNGLERVWKGQRAAMVTLSGRVLADLRRLKSISLEIDEVDSSFFHHLATKEHLTRLEFIGTCRTKYSRPFLEQVNHLRGLQELAILLTYRYYTSSLLSPERLSKLKKLTTHCSEAEANELRQKFACLGSVLLKQESSVKFTLLVL